MRKEWWHIEKPVTESPHGVVVSQHYRASLAGASILEAGGNAVDAAIATAFAVGVVEPWMSGLGGGGLMVTLGAEESDAQAINFGMRASRNLDPANYPLGGGVGGDLFSWPAVVDDRNVHGPLSIAVPGQVAGMALAHKKWGELSWAELLAPAIELAREGMEVDWQGTVRIAAAAGVLSRYADSAKRFLPDDRVPAGQWGGPPPRIYNPELVATLEQLAIAGGDDFYNGEIAQSIVADAASAGIPLDHKDLADYRVTDSPALKSNYRGHRVFATQGLTGGPSLDEVLAALAAHTQADDHATPTSGFYIALCEALRNVFEKRFESMGHDADPSCTSHISVADRHGRVVALTQTLLSVFGSKVTLPGTGMLMNNGIMWFDPRPGRPNSLAPGQSPLANMCPAVIDSPDGRRVAMGGSGGRRIIGAVAQVVSWLTDFGMELDSAMVQPRIDVSGLETVLVDECLPQEVFDALRERYDARMAQSMVYPNLFACPNCASFSPTQGARGMPFIYSPVAAAVGASR